MPSKQNIIYDPLEVFLITKKELSKITRRRGSDFISTFNYFSNNGFSRSGWVLIKKRVIPVRIKRCMRFFPEIVVERKYEYFSIYDYLKMKKIDKNFNYREIYNTSTIFNISKKLDLAITSDFIFDEDSIDGMYKIIDYRSYEKLGKARPEFMCKTLKKAKERIEEYLINHPIVFG